MLHTGDNLRLRITTVSVKEKTNENEREDKPIWSHYHD
jgi:hypothetical protein